MSYEHWKELLSMWAAMEENLMKLVFFKKTEEEVPMDELEVDIVKMIDYHYNVILPLESPCDEDDWRQSVSAARISLVMCVHTRVD